MIMGHGEFDILIQQKEEDKEQRSTEEEHRAMPSIPKGKALLLIQRILSLHHFLLSSISHNLGIASKVTTLTTNRMFSVANCLLHLQAVFRFTKKNATLEVG